MDKDTEIELTMDRRRAHRLHGFKDAAGKGARVRANAPASRSDGEIFYYEITIIKKCGHFGIGVGFSTKVSATGSRSRMYRVTAQWVGNMELYEIDSIISLTKTSFP